METTPLQQLSMAVSMLLLLVLVMKPKLRAALGEPQSGMAQHQPEQRK